MLFSSPGADQTASDYAQQILIDVSAAFGHTFSLLEEAFQKSVDADETVTDSAADACQQCQAVFVSDADCPGIQALYDALGLSLRIRSFSVPPALCGRHESPVSLYVGQVLSLDEATLHDAAASAFRFAQEQDVRLCAVPPSGGAGSAWDAALRAQEALTGAVGLSVCSAPEAISAMITSPERQGLLLSPPYAGSIFLAAGTALCSHPEAMHEFAFQGDCPGVYAPVSFAAPEGPQPFSAALAVAKMLRYSLKLPREGACVEAAVLNVLANRDPGQDGLEHLSRICEQITVAGELMTRGGIG